METIFLRPCMVDWKFLYSTLPLSWWGSILEWQSFFLRILKLLLHSPLASSITFEKANAVLISDPLLLFENSVTFRVLKFQGNFFSVSPFFNPLGCVLSGLLHLFIWFFSVLFLDHLLFMTLNCLDWFFCCSYPFSLTFSICLLFLSALV